LSQTVSTLASVLKITGLGASLRTDSTEVIKILASETAQTALFCTLTEEIKIQDEISMGYKKTLTKTKTFNE
jgi:hypothetical protein